jgi:biotin synthase
MKYDWTKEEIAQIYQKPLNDLLFEAHVAHRQQFDPNQIQISKLMSVKTGTCPEDCGYCSQSGHHKTAIEKEKLVGVDKVIEAAKCAKKEGATRFCMGGAWRSPPQKAMPELIAMIKKVKKLGLETCLTAGMLDEMQASQLSQAGLDYYNHNIDTSPEYYDKVITTRTFQDRLDTLNKVRDAGINVCCGGIVGLGETKEDRISFIQQLTKMNPHPQSIPINRLIAVAGTPLADAKEIDGIDLVRTIATCRILMVESVIRLTAGREAMSDELQAMCFFAGANSIFIGSRLLTEKNPSGDKDANLFKKLGLKGQEFSKAV